jgi:hypothetical protein
VAADGDDDIIGEPMIVHGLISSLCRFAADRIENPIHIVQVDVRGQRTEGASLWNPDLSSHLDDLLDEVQNLRVLDPPGDFI